MMDPLMSWIILGTCVLIDGAIQQVGVCDVSNLDAGGVDSSGELVSPDYPYSAPTRERTQPLCRMTITACPECYVRLDFEEINLPPCVNGSSSSGGCILGCDHVLVYDLNYPTLGTTRSIFARNQGDNFISISNRVYITFCHSVQNRNAYKRFRVAYKLMEKYTLITGEHNSPSAVGYFTSPNFPKYYALNREIYFYHLKNTNPDGFIRLGFEDWLLSPNSKMTIYFNNASSPEVYLTRKGSGERPFVFSGGPYLYLRFETGEDTIYNHNFVGFKAKYEFVKDEYWPEKPYTVCGEYFYDLYAGQFSFDHEKCFPGDKVDCLWVVRKKKDAALFSYHSHINLHLLDVNLTEGQDSLEIRGGNNSASPLLASFGANNLTGGQYTDEEALYIHLSAVCHENRRLKAVFTSFSYAEDDKCFYYYHFKCANGRCIFKQLICDGTDHCGDYSDEANCPRKDSTKKPCIHYRRCEDGFGYYCPTELCDRKWDCQDGSDELQCPDIITSKPISPSPYDFNLHTFIPVAMVTVLLAIAACVTISFCIRVKRSRQQNHQRGGIASAIRSLMPGERSQTRSNGTRVNINVEIQHYPDSPPSYNEAVRYDAYLGVCNHAYTPTDPADILPEPPPYTPTATEPLPIVYPLQGHGDLGWAGSGHSRGRYDIPPPNPPSYQESVRRERRRERRHSHGLYGVDPHRRQRRQNEYGEQREERSREGRHRQRRHRSHGHNRGPPAISEEIFIDTPPWAAPHNNNNPSNANRNNLESLSARDLLRSRSDQNTNAPNVSSPNDSNTAAADTRSGQQAQSRLRSEESTPSSLNNNNEDNPDDVEAAASQIVNRILNNITERMGGQTVNTQPVNTEPTNTQHVTQVNNSCNSQTPNTQSSANVCSNHHAIQTFHKRVTGSSSQDPRKDRNGSLSADFPSVHSANKVSSSTGASVNNERSALTPTNSQENTQSYVYDNPVFSLSGVADDDTTV